MTRNLRSVWPDAARARFGSLEVVKRNKCLVALALIRFSTIAFHLAALALNCAIRIGAGTVAAEGRHGGCAPLGNPPPEGPSDAHHAPPAPGVLPGEPQYAPPQPQPLARPPLA